MKMKLLAALTAATLTCGVIGSGVEPIAHAETGSEPMSCTYYSGTNIGRQNGDQRGSMNWALPVASYLLPLKDGTWMRVQGNVQSLSGSVLVEYYNKNFELTDRRIVKMELALLNFS